MAIQKPDLISGRGFSPTSFFNSATNRVLSCFSRLLRSEADSRTCNFEICALLQTLIIDTIVSLSAFGAKAALVSLKRLASSLALAMIAEALSYVLAMMSFAFCSTSRRIRADYCLADLIPSVLILSINSCSCTSIGSSYLLWIIER